MTDAALELENSIYIPTWTFADRIRKARHQTGMEQRDFATAIGLTSSTLASYETGRSTPRFRDVSMLAKRIQILTRIDYKWFLDIGDVGPAGIEPTTSTVESHHLAPVIPLFPDRPTTTASVAVGDW